jgi:hypothetical protein
MYLCTYVCKQAKLTAEGCIAIITGTLSKTDIVDKLPSKVDPPPLWLKINKHFKCKSKRSTYIPMYVHGLFRQECFNRQWCNLNYCTFCDRGLPHQRHHGVWNRVARFLLLQHTKTDKIDQIITKHNKWL